MIGTRFKVVTGYPGNAEMLLAVERGELDGNAGTSWISLVSIRPDWVREWKITVLLQMASRKHPDLPDVPLALDLARHEADRRVLELIFSRQAMAYPFVAPPDVAPERMAALRAAFEAAMKDPEFLAEARRQNLEIGPVPAAEIAAIVRRAYATPAEAHRARQSRARKRQEHGASKRRHGRRDKSAAPCSRPSTTGW